MRPQLPFLTAIGSGKGGTGKTFLTLNLAQALAAQGERVLVCDADLGLSNTAVQLGLAEGGDLPGLLQGRPLAEAVVRAPFGFDLLGAPAGSGGLADADGETALRLVHCLRRASGYDRVLIDLAAGVGSAVMTLAAHSDTVLLLVTPDPSSLTDAYAFLKVLLKRTGGRAPLLVVNRAGGPEARRTADALTQSARSFLGVVPARLGAIPDDIHVVQAMRRQTNLLASSPQSPAAAAIKALAASLAPPAAVPATSVR